MMKFSRKIGRSSQNSTSISRKKKKSNEKNGLGKSGKRSRGHKRMKTYKRVKIFHKGGKMPKIEEYTANLEYKKISGFTSFFNKVKTGNFEVSISVSQEKNYAGRETYTYTYSITIKLKMGNETMTLVLPINNYTGNLDYLKGTIKSHLFTYEQVKYTFDFDSNGSFFDGIIEKSIPLLNECQEEQKKLEEEEKLIERIKNIIDKIVKMFYAYHILERDSTVDGYEMITAVILMMQASTEYELFKTDQKTLAEKEKALIEGSTQYNDVEKDTRKLLVDAVLNRILRTKSLLIITSHLFREYELHENNVIEVIEILKEQDPNYDLTHFPPNATQVVFTNNPPYNLLDLLEEIQKRIQKIQVKEEQQNRELMKMIGLMTDIHIRDKLELEYGIIGEERIGEESGRGSGVWVREKWWAGHLKYILFIDSWIPEDQVGMRRSTS